MKERTHLEKLIRMYVQAAPINQWYEPKMELKKGKASITMTVENKYFHAANAVHGSVYFKMLDDAAFFAVNTLVEDVFVLTTNFTVNLLRPVIYGELRAEGEVLFNARKSFVAESRLYNNKNQLIATGSGNFVKSGIKLNEEVGYQ